MPRTASSMALYPAPSPHRTEPVIQPSYYTSSLFVDPLRSDIDDLLSSVCDQWRQRPQAPFSLFKSIWCAKGWKWYHLKTINDRSREAFLHVTCRLFLEKAHNQNDPLSQSAALLALYTLFSSQPEDTVPRLWRLHHIPIPLNVHSELYSLPSRLQDPSMKAIQSSVVYILNTLSEKNTFLLILPTQCFAQNPRTLPREIYLGQGSAISLDKRKKGRPSKNDKSRRVKEKIDHVEAWLSKTESWATAASSDGATSETQFSEYLQHKTKLLQSIDAQLPTSDGRSAIAKANHSVLARLKEVRTLLSNDNFPPDPLEGGTGIQRIESAIQDFHKGKNTGILELLEGSGLGHGGCQSSSSG
ncbi:hypothetical protein CC1G_01747 [Coprinopsis cinerea okayama7|uniref:Uncharacterized protein n=1 Tax=Coprinopsis cinerea (strain Okayama-7 / 130 / ATCC MYA-4618 / FGSC 9003) TaxID=240176 RepID=A8N2A7_COPC7|nr:hypothetical protein CC1G_01747 [Coprinopsis cinerea okayama7\|eukprot:XP_001829067.2 hypothetical protein CC1G_01747 [Coprinopsis cinerea okayama7\